MVFFIFKNWDPKTLHQKPLSPLDDLFPFRKKCVQSRKKNNLPISSVPLLWSPLLHKKTGDHKFGHFLKLQITEVHGFQQQVTGLPMDFPVVFHPQTDLWQQNAGGNESKKPHFWRTQLQKVLSKQNTGGDGFLEAFWKNITFSPSWKVSVFRGAVFTKHMANSHGEFHPHVADAIHGIPLPNMWRSIFGGSFHIPIVMFNLKLWTFLLSFAGSL